MYLTEIILLHKTNHLSFGDTLPFLVEERPKISSSKLGRPDCPNPREGGCQLGHKDNWEAWAVAVLSPPGRSGKGERMDDPLAPLELGWGGAPSA